MRPAVSIASAVAACRGAAGSPRAACQKPTRPVLMKMSRCCRTNDDTLGAPCRPDGAERPPAGPQPPSGPDRLGDGRRGAPPCPIRDCTAGRPARWSHQTARRAAVRPRGRRPVHRRTAPGRRGRPARTGRELGVAMRAGHARRCAPFSTTSAPTRRWRRRAPACRMRCRLRPTSPKLSRHDLHRREPPHLLSDTRSWSLLDRRILSVRVVRRSAVVRTGPISQYLTAYLTIRPRAAYSKPCG